MPDRRIQILLAALAGLLFVAAMVGLVTVGEDGEDVTADRGATTTRPDGGEPDDDTPDDAAPSTTAPAAVTTNPPTTTTALTNGSPAGSTDDTAGPGSDGTTATTAGSGLGASGAGEMASGPTAVADTGAPAILLPAGLAALAGAGGLRRLRRRAT